MSRFLTKDLWIGLTVLLVAAVFWFEAGKIRISPLDGPVNAAGLPRSLAYALGALAIILMLRSLIGTALGYRSTSDETGESTLADVMRPHLRAVGMLAIGVGYLLIVSWLGYAITIVALLLAVSLYNGASLNLRTAAVALIGGVFYHLLFVEFLGIPLPPGHILGPLLG